MGRLDLRSTPRRRLRGLSLIDLLNSNDQEIIPSLMARLGPVRAALDDHGGGLIISDAEIEELNNGKEVISLILDLDGACISCGAAPGTLRGIQDDLLSCVTITISTHLTFVQCSV